MKHLLLALAALLAAPAAAAQPPQGTPIVIGQSYALPSKLLGDTRRVNVYLPPHYGEPGRSFPVLYLLDGGEKEDFHHISALAQITAAYGEGQELIVVGVEGVDRRHDLTSPSTDARDLKVAPTSGGAAQYRRFLTQELKPWVAGNFPAASGRSALIGESLAGLFVLETLIEAPRSFDDYVAVSPSLWWNREALSKDIAAKLARPLYKGRRLFLALDGKPRPPEKKPSPLDEAEERLWSVLSGPNASGLDARLARLPEERHSSVYHPAALMALRSLYAVAGPGKE